MVSVTQDRTQCIAVVTSTEASGSTRGRVFTRSGLYKMTRNIWLVLADQDRNGQRVNVTGPF